MTQTENTRTILICHGTGCVSSKSPEIRTALEKETQRLGITTKLTGCHGFCQQGPIVIVEPDGVFYTRVGVEDVTDIVNSHLQNNKPVGRLFYQDPTTGKRIQHYRDIPFYKMQQRLILRNCGHINPEEIDDYLAVGGYEALKKVLFEMTPEKVIENINISGLRGRGGAGFPTGRKWEICSKASGEEKYIICNADEGDTGAFMDRSILEADPHSVLEGMSIAAHTVGAKKGFIYVRAEYPLAVKRLEIAITQARKKGFLGKDILGSGFDFDIEIFEGAGAFVCGEETALIESIEGRRGMPRHRPPFPVQSGLWGKPTLINNVKTYAYTPLIIVRGADWFSNIGTERSKGTAVFSITGKVANCGLVEVPMGTTLHEIIYGIGGGIPNRKKFKAVQTGGPSGGCLSEEFLGLPVDYESLTSAGSIMGSGGLVVMDEDTCIVDVAKYFLDFTQKESCGKCVPCRVGTRLMFEILDRITHGEGTAEDLLALRTLGDTIKKGALCGLGQTAPNPVLTTLRYFSNEYLEHIKEYRCRASVCKDLIEFKVIREKCTGCQSCVRVCPTGAITGPRSKPHNIDASKCIKCRSCYEICRFDAIAGNAIVIRAAEKKS
jgi:NADH:ubiquinone oxidoreductase subunit F (NADH-binding)/(2Fe-2S) ferredoxin/NAD-dependent dihydropyrimidine dehydrogenase PreA subunit